MSYKDKFSQTDWDRIVAAPMLAGIAMTAADPGGLWGAVRESTAAAGGIRSAKDSGGLTAEIATAYENKDDRSTARNLLLGEVKGKKPDEIVEAALAELGAVKGLIAAQAPDEAAGFATWIADIAKRVAEAGTEGGFMGFGGEKVSEAEKATLDRLNTALA